MTALFWGLSAVSLVGAAAVAFSRDVMRMALGLGAFLLGVAGFFTLFGFGFLALAEIFVYAGGVLVLLLFAIMLVHRSGPDSPALGSRHDALSAVAAVGLAALLVALARPLVPTSLAEVPSVTAGVEGLGSVLLGPMLPQFELAGVLLLAALVAVVSIAGGDE
jgi:NADH-quinone oxidoreductase subunit J